MGKDAAPRNRPELANFDVRGSEPAALHHVWISEQVQPGCPGTDAIIFDSILFFDLAQLLHRFPHKAACGRKHK